MALISLCVFGAYFGLWYPLVLRRQPSHVSQGLCPKFLRSACPGGGCQSCSYTGSLPLWNIFNLTNPGSLCQCSTLDYLINFFTYAASFNSGLLMSFNILFGSYAVPFVSNAKNTRINLQLNSIKDCFFFSGFSDLVV